MAYVTAGCPPCLPPVCPHFSPLFSPRCSPFLKQAGLSHSIASRDRFVVPAFRKHEKAGLPPGAFEMIDDETGENVIVWGVDGLDMPTPSDEELRWEPVKFALPGEVSDSALHRMLSFGETGDAAPRSDGNGEGWWDIK